MKNMNETTAPVTVLANGTNNEIETGASALTFEQLLACLLYTSDAADE